MSVQFIAIEEISIDSIALYWEFMESAIEMDDLIQSWMV